MFGLAVNMMRYFFQDVFGLRQRTADIALRQIDFEYVVRCDFESFAFRRNHFKDSPWII